ncbi:hypothetical protein JFN94_24815 [Burkholderia anthina]|uniref:Uncharacterized protein n=1 Tax=Burkholderia anthina TaxID=179879 RepID=A0A7T6VII5_9BURK|nr:hypothetical protein [Burkholderia anthina]QQK04579.1 hypothetical protein JFN94_24815 [Burkholderia anthina]
MNFFARLMEPSTHAALAGLAGVGSQLAIANGADPHTVGAIGTAVSALFGLLAVFMPEGSGASTTQPGA